MDVELLNRLQAREPAAQRELWRRVRPRLAALCCKMLRDPGLVDETVEDLWTDFAFVHVDKVQKPGALEGYLRMMAVRRCVRLRDFRRKHLSWIEGDGGSEGGEASAVAALDRPREIQRLTQCLTKLTTKVRQILRLRFHAELTQEAIGAALGVSKQYVGRVLGQGIDTLKRCMEAGP